MREENQRKDQKILDLCRAVCNRINGLEKKIKMADDLRSALGKYKDIPVSLIKTSDADERRFEQPNSSFQELLQIQY